MLDVSTNLQSLKIHGLLDIKNFTGTSKKRCLITSIYGKGITQIPIYMEYVYPRFSSVSFSYG